MAGNEIGVEMEEEEEGAMTAWTGGRGGEWRRIGLASPSTLNSRIRFLERRTRVAL